MLDETRSNDERKVYINKCADGRLRVLIVYSDGHRVNISYPRMLMEEKLGRPLEPNEDVHHIDGNALNNDLENLTIIPHDEHQKMHRKYYDKMAVCEYCGKEFLWTAIKQRKWKQNRSKHIFCSKRCVGAFGRREQLSRNV